MSASSHHLASPSGSIDNLYSFNRSELLARAAERGIVPNVEVDNRLLRAVLSLYELQHENGTGLDVANSNLIGLVGKAFPPAPSKQHSIRFAAEATPPLEDRFRRGLAQRYPRREGKQEASIKTQMDRRWSLAMYYRVSSLEKSLRSALARPGLENPGSGCDDVGYL